MIVTGHFTRVDIELTSELLYYYYYHHIIVKDCYYYNIRHTVYIQQHAYMVIALYSGQTYILPGTCTG